jgi:hypothetical protein
VFDFTVGEKTLPSSLLSAQRATRLAAVRDDGLVWRTNRYDLWRAE